MAFQAEDVDAIQEEIAWLSTQISLASELVAGDGLAMCAEGTTRYAPTENAITSANVVIAQVRGMIALIEGDQDRFETHLKEAVALEDQTDFPAGPPTITKPSFEQYGEWLLEQGQYEKAIAQFDKALHRMPRRSKSLMGKMQALEELKQDEEAAQIQEELESIFAKADKVLLGMR